MRAGLRAVALGVVSAALVAGSWAVHRRRSVRRGTLPPSCSGAQHIAGVRGQVLVKGRPGTCEICLT